MPKMSITLGAPDRIGALRPGVPLSVTLQSTSLCPESLKLRVSDPDHPDRFVEPGMSQPTFQLPASDGEVRTVLLEPEHAAPRGEGGALRLEAQRLDGHPSTTYPAPVAIRFYTPLWTEEFPAEARAAFVVIATVMTGLLALPRVLFADPIRAHREGDSSVVSGRKRLRWFLTSLLLSLAGAFVAVYWAMARFLP
jgi:hypothetical protein